MNFHLLACFNFTHIGHKFVIMIEERVSVPAKVSHGIREAEDSGTDHGGDGVEGGVPPLGWP